VAEAEEPVRHPFSCMSLTRRHEKIIPARTLPGMLMGVPGLSLRHKLRVRYLS